MDSESQRRILESLSPEQKKLIGEYVKARQYLRAYYKSIYDKLPGVPTGEINTPLQLEPLTPEQKFSFHL